MLYKKTYIFHNSFKSMIQNVHNKHCTTYKKIIEKIIQIFEQSKSNSLADFADDLYLFFKICSHNVIPNIEQNIFFIID